MDKDCSGMEMIHKGGRTIFTPYVERDVTAITSFSKWEQAFCVYLAIYTKIVL